MKQQKAFIVLGLGYGDEGKGLATEYLCRNSDNPIVIRFNGGQQAGHTVVDKKGFNRVFSNLGSGTLLGIPTYWSKFCTFSPAHFFEEYSTLSKKIKFFIDPLCPVTTHYDILFNRALEKTRDRSRHGSCGLGFGATVERHKNTSLKLTVKDLFDEKVVINKLNRIRRYYESKFNLETKYSFELFDHELGDSEFKESIKSINKLRLASVFSLANEDFIFSSNQPWRTYIFEGAQGILLDVEHGTSPYVTKSNTTSKNAIEILNRNAKQFLKSTEIVYVTRGYLTRHGAGPFRKSARHLKLKNTESETNYYNEFQGRFKRSYLDLTLIEYALKCDSLYSYDLIKSLLVTCIDQFNTDKIPVLFNHRLRWIYHYKLPTLLSVKFNSAKFSFHKDSQYLM